MKLQSVKDLWRRTMRPKQAMESFRSSRSKALSIVFLVVFGIVAIRATSILLFPPSKESLENLARRQYQTKIDLAPYRGNIYDRRGEPLAISIRRPSFYVNPRIFDPSSADIRKISRILNMPASKIREVADRKNYFAWLARKVDHGQASALIELKINGLFDISEPSRFYPGGTELDPLLGYVGIDNNGLAGLELAFDKVLTGDKLSTTRYRDARGKIIYQDSLMASPEKTGRNVVLTIDSAIQDIAQKALFKGLTNAKATSGFAIVSDPHTGRILAVANQSMRPPAHSKKDESKRNFAFSDLFEPGSVVKPLIIAKALELGVVKLDEVHNTYNGTYKEDRWQIRDDHGAPTMTTTDIITHSSNIGTYNIMKRLGPEKVAAIYAELGFGGSEQLLGFPGQNKGRISNWKNWKPIRFANVCFGQGFYASALELVQAFGAIANGGSLMKPYMIDHIASSEGGMIETHSPEQIRRIYSPESAYRMRSILQKTVEEGTGRKAKMPYYTSAGKTGTSEKVDPVTKTYSDTLRLASFVGFTPVNDPHLVIYVTVNEPGTYPRTGGWWAAPIFKEIAEESLRYLNVAPDKAPPPPKEPLAKGKAPQLQKSPQRPL